MATATKKAPTKKSAAKRSGAKKSPDAAIKEIGGAARDFEKDVVKAVRAELRGLQRTFRTLQKDAQAAMDRVEKALDGHDAAAKKRPAAKKSAAKKPAAKKTSSARR